MRIALSLGPLLFVLGCHPALSVPTCSVTSGTLSATPGSSSSLSACAWNGDSSNPAFILQTDSWKVAMQMRGASGVGLTCVGWTGATPPFVDDEQDVQSIHQSLSNGQATITLHELIPSADFVGVGGGDATLSGEALPHTTGTTATVTLSLMNVGVSSNSAVDVAGTLFVGLARVQ